MKKIYAMLIALVLVSSAALSAKTLTHNTSEVISTTADKLDLKLNLGDLSKVSQAEVNEKIAKFINENVPSKSTLQCSVTVEGSVSVGVASVKISVTVSGTCAEIAKSGTEIANQVLNAVKAALAN